MVGIVLTLRYQAGRSVRLIVGVNCPQGTDHQRRPRTRKWVNTIVSVECLSGLSWQNGNSGYGTELDLVFEVAFDDCENPSIGAECVDTARLVERIVDTFRFKAFEIRSPLRRAKVNSVHFGSNLPDFFLREKPLDNCVAKLGQSFNVLRSDLPFPVVGESLKLLLAEGDSVERVASVVRFRFLHGPNPPRCELTTM